MLWGSSGGWNDKSNNVHVCSNLVHRVIHDNQILGVLGHSHDNTFL